MVLLSDSDSHPPYCIYVKCRMISRAYITRMRIRKADVIRPLSDERGLSRAEFELTARGHLVGAACASLTTAYLKRSILPAMH